jgi:hypothetical protein
VPEKQLARIAKFSSGELQPTYFELQGPRQVFGKSQAVETFPVELQKAMLELDRQIDQLYQRIGNEIGNQDFQSAVRLRDEANVLKKEKELITRESRAGFVVENLGKIKDPLLKLRWAVWVFYVENETSPELVDYLRAALESKEQRELLSWRLGSRFHEFVD